MYIPRSGLLARKYVWVFHTWNSARPSKFHRNKTTFLIALENELPALPLHPIQPLPPSLHPLDSPQVLEVEQTAAN